VAKANFQAYVVLPAIELMCSTIVESLSVTFPRCIDSDPTEEKGQQMRRSPESSVLKSWAIQ
jgi:hypothetical protein